MSSNFDLTLCNPSPAQKLVGKTIKFPMLWMFQVSFCIVMNQKHALLVCALLYEIPYSQQTEHHQMDCSVVSSLILRSKYSTKK
jgi:hypothetical protein